MGLCLGQTGSVIGAQPVTTGNTAIAPSQGWVGSSTTLGGTNNLIWNSGSQLLTIGGSGSWVPQETRKAVGPGLTVAQVKASAHLVKASMLASPSYKAAAKRLSLKSTALEEADMLQELHDHALPVYDYEKVDNFLYREALRQGATTRWVWKPLRATDLDRSKDQAWSMRPEMGMLYAKQYGRPVPERVLNLAADLLDCLPDALFLVSDFEVVKPDPFLAITTPGLLAEGKIFIIEQWDEPGFKDTPDRPAGVIAKAVHVHQ